MADEPPTKLFIYGTLIHPHILSRVLTGSLRPSLDSEEHFAHITARPAIVKDYQVRRVKGEDYPALVVRQDAEYPVRGVILEGLSRAEIASLDLFEGDEYAKTSLQAVVPSNESPISNEERASWSQDKIWGILDEQLPRDRVRALLAETEPAEHLAALSYVWVASESLLEPLDGPRGLWDFKNFRSKSKRWTGEEWTNHGGPEGVSDLDTPSTPIPQDGHGEASPQGGFDEVRRTLERGTSSSSFSTFSMPAQDDPWADRPTRQTPSASTDRSDNPWAASEALPEVDEASSKIDGNAAAALKSASGQHLSAPDGYPLEVRGQEVPGFERLGKPVRRWFLHGGSNSNSTPTGDQGYTSHHTPERRFLSFNNGSLGTCPKPVMESYIALSRKAEECADSFERRYARQATLNLRTRIAKMVKCPVRELVLVRNTTAGTNAIIRGYPWEEDDYVIHLNTLYGAVSNTLQYVFDSNGRASPKRIVVDVTYPLSHEELVKTVVSALKAAQAEGKKVKMAVFEVISSRPGVRVPWEQLVQVCREHGVLSLVDGAHSFGHVPLDLDTVQPDFFVSTVHKWAYAHRGGAFMYVPVRNQGLVPSTPTSWGYRSAEARKAQPEEQPGDDFLAQWAETGVIDYSPILSLDAALDFRERLGGEDRIQQYNNSLALLGGHRIAQILDVSLLETSPQPMLTTHMVNLPLPIVPRVIGGHGHDAVNVWLYKKGGEAYIWDTLLDEFHTAVTVWAFQGQVFVRVSAQIWLDLDDFDYLGRALKEICRRINSGEAELKAVE